MISSTKSQVQCEHEVRDDCELSPSQNKFKN